MSTMTIQLPDSIARELEQGTDPELSADSCRPRDRT
jgi:hypothetical protein